MVGGDWHISILTLGVSDKDFDPRCSPYTLFPLQSHTQSPQALWPAVGRLERLWRFQILIGCSVFTVPVPQSLSWQPTAGQRA